MKMMKMMQRLTRRSPAAPPTKKAGEPQPSSGNAVSRPAEPHIHPIDVILHKRDGVALTDPEIQAFIRAIVDRTPENQLVTDAQIAAFLMAVFPTASTPASSPPSPQPCASPARPSTPPPPHLHRRQALHRRRRRQDLPAHRPHPRRRRPRLAHHPPESPASASP
jgi:hypothetical protein